MSRHKKNEIEQQVENIDVAINVPEIKMEAPEVFLDSIPGAVEVKERNFNEVNESVRDTVASVAKDKQIKSFKSKELMMIASSRLRSRRLGSGIVHRSGAVKANFKIQ